MDDTSTRQHSADTGRLYDTVAGLDQASPQDLLDALALLREVRARLDQWEPALIGAARSRGVTWGQLAPALGVASRQAAERRYLRLNPQADEPGMTREHRVDIARAQRAGERAVAEWARENAATLRELAGQVCALDAGSAGPGCADRVRAALGGDDAAALLAPLADAMPGLRTTHPALADRIGAVTAAAEEVRNRRGTPRPHPGGPR